MLAIWMYFWDEAAWVPDTTSVSAEPVVVLTDLGAGGGHRHDQAPPDYWDVRASFLHYIHDKPEPEVETASVAEVVAPVTPTLPLNFLPRLIAERPVVARKAEASIDLTSLRGNFERLRQIDRKIALLQKQERLQKQLELQEKIARARRRQIRLKRNLAIAEKLQRLVRVYVTYSTYKKFLP